MMKKEVVPTLKKAHRESKYEQLGLKLYHIYTNILFFWKIEMLDLHAISMFATCRGESDTPSSFGNCGIINLMTIMMKTLKNV